MILPQSVTDPRLVLLLPSTESIWVPLQPGPGLASTTPVTLRPAGTSPQKKPSNY